MRYAPIILFVFKRLDHVKTVVNALLTNPEARFSKLIVYSDGARNREEEPEVSAVRDYVSGLEGFAEVQVVARDQNWGIEKNEIDGITETLRKYDRAIILEDDIMVGSHFLSFMNTALEKYKSEKNVFSVTGYSYIEEKNIAQTEKECAFSQLTSAWGWATWKDRWEHFCKMIPANELLRLCEQKYREKFDHGFDFSDMVLNQYKKGYFTWDILWYWSVFRKNGLTLAPVYSLVNNIGMDGSGVHYTDKNGKNRVEAIENRSVTKYPDVVEEDPEVRKMIEDTLRSSLEGQKGKKLGVLYRTCKKKLRWLQLYFRLKREAKMQVV